MKSEFCINHPDRKRYGSNKFCWSCVKEKRKKKKDYADQLSSWYELNLKDLLHDAKIMEVRELAMRYCRSQSSICTILKKQGIKARHRHAYIKKPMGKIIIREVIPDFRDACFTGAKGKETFVSAQ